MSKQTPVLDYVMLFKPNCQCDICSGYGLSAIWIDEKGTLPITHEKYQNIVGWTE